MGGRIGITFAGIGITAEGLANALGWLPMQTIHNERRCV